jgi:FRG domain
MATSIEAESWGQLNEALFDDSWNNDLQRFRSHVAFRGLSRAEYDLSTSLERLKGDFAKVEGHLLRNFTKYAHGAILEARSTWYWLTLAQHHGLPTRLLDWTFSPYVALHFATSNTEDYDHDGVIWCVDYVAVRNLLPELLLTEIKREEGMSVFTIEMLERKIKGFDDLANLTSNSGDFAIFFEPPSLDGRIVNQLALFSMMSTARTPLDRWLAEHPNLYRQVVIPANRKWEYRDKLDEIGVTERVLFPGLDGLAGWLRRYYAPGPRT